MASPFLIASGVTAAAVLAGAAALHLIPRLGGPGRRFSDALCRAPALDLLVTYFTVAPLIVGPIVAGWLGLAGALVGQIVGLLVWQVLHELANRRHVRGPRIVKTINAKVGRLRNHTAVWLTAIATPMFWVTRMLEVFLYPVIAWLVKFPQYRGADWVRVSRHKFQGLVGHDLIWCLYCDWMTGVWSLGSEMLRNVESFWCPIRFDSSKKCANCATDFPDLENGWVRADGTMAEVTQTIDRMYAAPPNAWFGHPVRITVGGRDPAPTRTGGDSSDGNGHGATGRREDAVAQRP